MKNLSRFLTAILCFAPFCVNAAGPVATTAGSNLTAFNPSTAYNNQWATMSNGRYDSNNTSAKADFGNCNAVVLRCAQPKCGNGGCTDTSVASAIVTGCVQSNENCKQYGNDLVQYMTAQLVASSTAKVNEQNAAAQQAAAAAAAQQSQQQMAAMQQQVQQMQLQMQQQQAESQQQIQAALAQQAAQSAAAIESMKSAATSAAMENEAGISAYQQDAINRGISADILERQKITGQVMTELENAEVQLKELKTVMNTAFEYAGCDPRGNNCTGPKRVKKWRELALEFLNPYDETINNVYDALELAQLVGVDLSDIYMMLNNSCNRWGQYMCPRMAGGQIRYPDSSNGSKSVPEVCTGGLNNDCIKKCNVEHWCDVDGEADAAKCNNCVQNCLNNPTNNCQKCTLLKVLSSDEDVYEGWVNADYSTNDGNTTVVACASGALDSSALFARRTKNKNGAGLVDIDKLDVWLNQKEPNKTSRTSVDKLMSYCYADDGMDVLEKAISSKSVSKTNGYPLCVKDLGSTKTEDKDDCGYISPIYAVCDTHLYNAGKKNASEIKKRYSNECSRTEINNSNLTEKTRVLWAQKVSNACVVKWCSDGYKPTSAGCVWDDDWKADGTEALEYNKGKREFDEHEKAEYGEITEIIALKTTVISQQMYKQYEYLSATLRRLKTQLEKATLTAKLQAAGAKDDESSSSGLLGGGSSKTSQYRDCSGKSKQGLLECMRENYSILATQIKTNKKCDKYAKEQLTNAVTKLKSLTKLSLECKTGTVKDCGDCLDSYDTGLSELDSIILKEESERRGYGRY